VGASVTPFRLAVLSLVRQRASAVIAILAIATSVATSGLLFRLYLVSNSRFATMAKGYDAVIGAKAGGIEILLNSLNAEGSYPDFVPAKLYESLRSREAIRFGDGTEFRPSYLRSVVPLVWAAQYHGYRVVGTSADFLTRPSSEDSLQVVEGHWPENAGETALGAEVATAESLHTGDTISVLPALITTGSSPIPLKVVGLLQRRDVIWDKMLFTNVPTAQKILGQVQLGDRSIWGSEVLHYYLINLDEHGLSPLKALINGRTVAQVVSVPDETQKLKELTGTGHLLGLIVSAFIILLGSLSVVSMLVARFDGMSVQIAVVRALGYRTSEIARWLLWEGFLLGSTACVVGGFLDLLLFPWVRSFLGSALPETVHCSIYNSAWVWLAAILATTLSVSVPILRMAQQNVHRALQRA
jgi:putative ABC transport system permease protein